MNCRPGICAFGRTFVGGQGQKPASLLVCGEAPGARELEAGVPFIGPAGKKLDWLLATVGISRTDAYVANTVCCVDLTRDIRRPLPSEIEACWPRLLDEITTCDPKLILCLGNVPQTEFFPGLRISAARGKLRAWTHPITGATYTVLSTYHPAYLLRQGSQGTQDLILSDLRLAAEIIGEAHETTNNSR